MPDLGAPHVAVLLVAAFLAGAVNAVAGGGSLISFPALLLAGYGALAANVTNTVALLPGYLGGSLAYRPELNGQAIRVRYLGLVGAAGAVAGAAGLVAGPATLFSRIVPWLILLGCALMALQSPLQAAVRGRHRRDRPDHRSPPLLLADLVCGAYGAYFGAGLGVLVLAMLGIFLSDTLQRLNALKGLLSLVINGVAAAYFIGLGPVAWRPVAIMAPAALAGGSLGVGVARRLGERLLRVLVILFGTAVAIRLLV